MEKTALEVFKYKKNIADLQKIRWKDKSMYRIGLNTNNWQILQNPTKRQIFVQNYYNGIRTNWRKQTKK